MTPIIEGLVAPKQRTHAWSAEDAKRARTGHYNACDGKGWQKCEGSLPATHTEDRDSHSKMQHALMMAQEGREG